MKKIITLIFGLSLVYSCSTSNDGNGNSTTTVVPVTPSSLIGIVASTTQINLSWTDNSTNETGFKIERKTGTGNYAVVGTTAADINTFNDTGLTASTTYSYRVYSFNVGGNSPTYTNELTLTTNSNNSVTDVDGNIYPLVTICNQTWTKSNLNVSHYRNGDIIPEVTSSTAWASLTTGAWCYYANMSSNGVTYGKLYNWFALNDPRGLAPSGYHIPTSTEWTTLITCLGGNTVAGDALKEAGTGHWIYSSTATNSSGFTGLPGGFRDYSGSFNAPSPTLTYCASWWSISEKTYVMYYNRSSVDMSTSNQSRIMGCSVRCVKD